VNINPNAFLNFLNAGVFIDYYNKFLSLFPAQTHWLVSAIILASLIVAFFVLISSNWLFILVLIILLPVLYPVLKNFFGEIFIFLQYLWNVVSTGVPKA
jgi:type IV secretory pathway TrbL component